MKTILWHSNAPITLTGYGLQTALFVPRIRDLGYDMTLNCPMSLTTAPISWDGMMILGAAGDPLGNDLLPHRAGMYDLTITLCDLFGLFPCSSQLAGKKVAHWMPVDTHPMGERDIAALRATGGVPVAVSRFGSEMIRREGFEPLYVPHGIDTEVFKPGDSSYREAAGISPDTFVIGIKAVNKPDSRKGLDQQMQAFARFHRNHPDSLLCMHMPKTGGWDLAKIALNLGIPDSVIFPDQHAVVSQLIGNAEMAAWYNSLDVLSASGEAEGFGVPALEAQSCGIPVVTTKFSAMQEMCGAGWSVNGQRHWVGGHESWWMTPSVNAIAGAYEMAFEARNDQGIRDEARAFALGYDANLIARDYWKPALEEIEARFSG